jgi:hypothetical protein
MCVGYVLPKEEDGDTSMKGDDVKDEEGEEKVEEVVGTDGKAVELRSDAEDEAEVEEVEPEEEEAHTEGPAPREDVMGADDVGVEVAEEITEAEEDEKEKAVEEGGGVEDVPGALTKEWAAPVPPPEDVAMDVEQGKEDDDADGEAEVDETGGVTPAITEPTKEAEETKPTEDLPDPLEGALRTDDAGDLTLVSIARTELLELATTASLAMTFTLPPAPSSPTSTADPSSAVDALTELFPDLSLYTGLPSDAEPADKRVDESMSSVAAGKLAHASRLFDVKPVLVGALDPARHLYKGKWVGLDEVPAVEDGKDVGIVRQDTVFTGNCEFAPIRLNWLLTNNGHRPVRARSQTRGQTTPSAPR